MREKGKSLQSHGALGIRREISESIIIKHGLASTFPTSDRIVRFSIVRLRMMLNVSQRKLLRRDYTSSYTMCGVKIPSFAERRHSLSNQPEQRHLV